MMTFRKKISVIIPAYNIEDLIVRCLKSVRDQTYPSELMEIIVVDDGSSDNTYEVAMELADKYTNVQAIHKENGGSSSARNLGIEHATGEFLCFVDSDDWMDSNAIELLIRKYMETHADVGAADRYWRHRSPLPFFPLLLLREPSLIPLECHLWRT